MNVTNRQFDAHVVGNNYIKVTTTDRQLGRSLIFYINQAVWGRMSADQLESDLQLTQHAEIVVDPGSNTIIKCRHQLSEIIEIVLEGW